MAKSITEKEETFGLINAMITLCDNFPKLEFSSNYVNLSIGPFDFMLNIIRSLGQQDKLIDWLVKILTYSLPAIELSVKGLLLSSLKSMLFCNIDPRIPNQFRLSLRDYEIEDYINSNRGIFFDIKSIDYNNMLDVSPFTDYGKTLYFGLENVTSPYQLLRGEDLNAFLWCVYNKGYFPNPQSISSVQDIHANAQGDSVFHPITIDNVPQSEGLVLGNVYQFNGSTTLNIVAREVINQEGGDTLTNNATTNKLQRNVTRTCSYTVLPFSHNNLSANWNVNRELYFDFLTPNKKHKDRDYSKDIGLFNLAYINDTSPNSGIMKFTILPKPFVHLPCKGEPAWRIQRILFNANGEPDPKGNYTVKTNSQKRTVTDTEITYDIDGAQLIIDVKSGAYRLSTTDFNILPTILYQCYKGLTVYEFDYDFVMGVKLFDAKTIASQLLDMTFNFRAGLGVSARVTYLSTETQYRIAEVVRKLLNTDGTEIEDCFFTFSNDEENAMMEKAEQLKAGGYAFNGAQTQYTSINPSEILNMLDGISDTATLEENSEILRHTFEQISAQITDEIPGEEGYGLQINFIFDMVVNFVISIVNSLLSPKIILLFLINKAMLGDFSVSINIEDFLRSIWNLIMAIIREVVNLILQELLELILSLLSPLILCIQAQMIKEQIQAYRDVLKWIINNCTFSLSGAEYPSQIDTVVGADIIDNTSDEEPQAQSSECAN